MTPKEKARELVYKFMDTRWDMSKEDGKECALIAVDEIIRESKLHDKTTYQHGRTSYWQEVKNEINKL